MDTRINEIIIRLKNVEVMLIEIYQLESTGRLQEAIDRSIKVNSLLIDSGLAFSNVALDLLAKQVTATPILKIVK